MCSTLKNLQNPAKIPRDFQWILEDIFGNISEFRGDFRVLKAILQEVLGFLVIFVSRFLVILWKVSRFRILRILTFLVGYEAFWSNTLLAATWHRVACGGGYTIYLPTDQPTYLYTYLYLHISLFAYYPSYQSVCLYLLLYLPLPTFLLTYPPIYTYLFNGPTLIPFILDSMSC